MESTLKAAVCVEGEWRLTSKVDAIFAAGDEAIFVDTVEALKTELRKEHDKGLEPGLTRVQATNRYGNFNENSHGFMIRAEPIVDPDKIKTQAELEALCRKVGKIDISGLRNILANWHVYQNHPEFFCDWQTLKYDPAKKSALLKRKQSIQRRQEKLGIIRVNHLRGILESLHTALFNSTWGIAIQRYRHPKDREGFIAVIVACHRMATLNQSLPNARACKEWKPALTAIAPLLRKYAKEKGSNRDFYTIMTREYREARIDLRELNKQGKEVNGKVKG